MLPIDTVSRFSPIHSISAKSQQVALNFLLPAILLAGAATCGFALAGYLPTWSAYIGISVELVLASVILAAHCFKPKRVFENKWTSELPEEIKKEFLKYLSIEELKSLLSVCKSWNAVAKTVLSFKLKQFVEKTGWQEENVNYLKAYHSLTCLGAKTNPKLVEKEIKYTFNTNTDHFFSGNYWICAENYKVLRNNLYYTRRTLHVWCVSSKEHDLTKKCERTFENVNFYAIGFFAQMVYIPLMDGDIFIWNIENDTCDTWTKVHIEMVTFINVSADRIFTHAGRNAYKLWTKEQKLLKRITNGEDILAVLNDKFYTIDNNVDDKFFVYKNLIFYPEDKWDPVSREKMASRILSLNPLIGEEKVLFETDNSITNLVLSNFTLLFQTEDSSFIYMYNLESEKWMQGFDPGENYSVKGAFGGLLVTASPERDIKIWDFR